MIYQEEKHTDSNGYAYTTVANDENKVRTYTLKNGLTVFLAQNFDTPKIQTYIAVRTGSNRDPKDNTGLAHYLEHMMFKGSSKLGTLDWEKEKPLLDTLALLFEEHKVEKNPNKKKEIYNEIDRLSQEASKYALANEYDKAVSSLGAVGTNAHTWLDETVYKNAIPKNELEKWLRIERERFSDLVLRLFHTELETVYEEFNRSQDNDARTVNEALMELLFPTHPNGQQTTLGKAEHLKNPSMKAIYEYFSTYYVPNNYAFVLVGDIDFEESIKLIDQYFGSLEYKALPSQEDIIEEPMTQVVSRVIKSPTIPRVQLAWRTDSYGTRESMLADVVANILSNRGEAGLMDLNINQKQTALYAQAYSVGFKKYGYLSAVIVPKDGDSLEAGVEMIKEQINLIKKGDFPDWLIPAIINDFKFQRLKALETANGLASNLYDVYIKGRSWKEELEELSLYEQITKAEVVAFANSFFQENYAVVYKEQGENTHLIRVENPNITPVQINREEESAFLKEILNTESEDIEPEFIDYQKAIKQDAVQERSFSFVQNEYNDIAQVHFLFPFGSDHDKEWVLAVQLLEYLGTEHYLPQELKQEFYKIGVSYHLKTSNEQVHIHLIGLEENIQKGTKLLYEWWEKVKPDTEIYATLVQSILEGREAQKNDKGRIMKALMSYAKYGAHSRFRNIIPQERLLSIDIQELTDKIKSLQDLPYEVFYYGKNKAGFKSFIAGLMKPITKEIPTQEAFNQPDTQEKVFFTDYDMVQVEMCRVAKGLEVNKDNFGKISVFNEYFGRGLSSVVFQEMRESKSLAYSVYVSYQSAEELYQSDYITSYIGTQPDKLFVAISTLDELMSSFPKFQSQFDTARKSALKKIQTGRIKRTNIFFNYHHLKKLGIDYDIRKDMYNEILSLNLDTLEAFYNVYIKNQTYNTALLGNNHSTFTSFSSFEHLTKEQIFNF